MDILEVENDIITELQDTISDLKMEASPDKPEDYKMLHPKGAIIVRFNGAEYEKPANIGFTQQNVNYEFVLQLLVKGLRDHQGGYRYINDITAALTGFSPIGCGNIYPNKTKFIRVSGGIWEYSLSFTVPTENYGA